MAERIYAKAELIDKYLKRLVSKKIEHIGTGTEQMAFQHPTLPNVVVKLMGRRAGFGEWAMLCHKNQSNPYLPKIYSINAVKLRHDPKGEDRNHLLIFTEKLESLSLYSDPEIEQTFGTPLFVWLTKQTKPAQTKVFKSFLARVKDRKLREAIGLAAFKQPSTCAFDISLDNVMLRGSTPVINDPWIRIF